MNLLILVTVFVLVFVLPRIPRRIWLYMVSMSVFLLAVGIGVGTAVAALLAESLLDATIYAVFSATCTYGIWGYHRLDKKTT